MIRHQFKTQDLVTLNAVETGNPSGQAILFVHGLSQSWRSWMRQFADPRLRERFRLVALDLRGHGESQGAIGAIDQEGKPLASLCDAQYNDGNVETTSYSWAYDLDAAIEALHLDRPLLIGWSAGAWVIQSYFLAHSALAQLTSNFIVTESYWNDLHGPMLEMIDNLIREEQQEVSRRAEQARAHGVEWDSQQLRDFGIAELFVFAEHQDLAVVGVKPLQSLADP